MCCCGRLVSMVERWLPTPICCQGTTIQASKSLTVTPLTKTEYASSSAFTAVVVQFVIQIDSFFLNQFVRENLNLIRFVHSSSK